jgi:uncharacterized protein DUF402
MASLYGRGDHALFRYVWPEKVFWAVPVTVVEDSEDRTVLWVAPGSPFMRPPTLRVPIPSVAAGDWTLAQTTWFGGGVLMIGEKGVSHAIWVMWDEQEELSGWYVNLEEPRRRTPLGFDTTDHTLDIVVHPDRSWQWKDEEELVEAVEVGLQTPEKAHAIRAEGESVVERIEAWSAPFNEGWENWRPEPDWQLPSIPDGWDRLSA